MWRGGGEALPQSPPTLIACCSAVQRGAVAESIQPVLATTTAQLHDTDLPMARYAVMSTAQPPREKY